LKYNKDRLLDEHVHITYSNRGYISNNITGKVIRTFKFSNNKKKFHYQAYDENNKLWKEYEAMVISDNLSE